MRKLPLVILLTVLTFYTASASVFAQSSAITGTVIDQSTEESIAGVNIGIIGTKKGTFTNEFGEFTLDALSAGEYTLIVSAVGYKTFETELHLNRNQTKEFNIELEKTFLDLHEVEIVGRSNQTYKSDYSFAATKTLTLSKDIPQSISVVTKEVLADQNVYRLGEAVKNISGINQFSGYNDFTLRGFRSGSGNERLVNGLKAGFGFWNQPLTPHLERIEVIKGPASALFANTNPGGTVNMVTKKPLPYSRNRIGFTTGSYDTYRATGDFSGPLTEDRDVLYRLNIGYENADSFRRLQFNDSYLLAPSLSFIPNEKTSVNVDLVYSYTKTRLDRGQAIFNQSDDLTSTPISFSLSQPGDYQDLTDFYATISLNHNFSDNLSFNLSYLKFNYQEDLQEHRTSNVFLPDQPEMLQLAYIRRLQEDDNDSFSSYFVGKAETGSIQHKIVFGLDFNQNETNRSQIGARGDNFFIVGNDSLPGGNVGNFDLENPVYSLDRNPETYVANWFSQPWLDDPVRSYTTGVYLQNQMKMGESLQVLLGLRQEFYTNRLSKGNGEFDYVNQQKLIPRVGAVYSVNSNLNIYGTYVEGFQPQSATILQDSELYGGPFDPLTSRMIEGGFKSEFLNDRLLVNLALYQITQNNILVNANDQANPNKLEQRGQERARGFELDVNGVISRSFSVTANYAFNAAKITESDNADIIGRVKENAPKHQAGFWGKYTLYSGRLSGLGLAFGGNFVSERNTFESALQLPGYTIFNGALFYQVDNLKLSVNANNLFDKTHWTGGYNYGRIYPGTPRHALASISYSF